MEGSGFQGYARAERGPIQRTATAATTTAGVSAGKHDGTFYDAEPDGAAVYSNNRCDVELVCLVVAIIGFVFVQFLISK